MCSYNHPTRCLWRSLLDASATSSEAYALPRTTTAGFFRTCDVAYTFCNVHLPYDCVRCSFTVKQKFLIHGVRIRKSESSPPHSSILSLQWCVLTLTTAQRRAILRTARSVLRTLSTRVATGHHPVHLPQETTTSITGDSNKYTLGCIVHFFTDIYFPFPFSLLDTRMFDILVEVCAHSSFGECQRPSA